MTGEKTGQIVWHDLFTSARQEAMALFQSIAGWDYLTEHATDFAWGGGEKDFVLALSHGEAGAGLIAASPGMPNGWVAYVDVPDVDAIAAHAVDLGGEVVRCPFDVPGVGRNALLRDPRGALIGISMSRHDFPAPRRQFGREIYLSAAGRFPAEFYATLFNWAMHPSPRVGQEGDVVLAPSGVIIARQLPGLPSDDRSAVWVPSIAVADAERASHLAQAFQADRLELPERVLHQEGCVFIRTACGAYACLSQACADSR